MRVTVATVLAMGQRRQSIIGQEVSFSWYLSDGISISSKRGRDSAASVLYQCQSLPIFGRLLIGLLLLVAISQLGGRHQYLGVPKLSASSSTLAGAPIQALGPRVIPHAAVIVEYLLL